MQTLRLVVLIAALLMLAKGFWCVAAPGGLQRITDMWLGLPGAASRAVGTVLIIGGLILIAAAVVHMNGVVAAVTVLGTGCCFAGLMHMQPPVIRAFGRGFGSGSRLWTTRVAGSALLAAGILLLFVYFRGAAA